MCMCACNTEYCCSLPSLDHASQRRPYGEDIAKHQSFSSHDALPEQLRSPASSSHSGPRWADMSDSEDDQESELLPPPQPVPLAKSQARLATSEHTRVQPRVRGRGKIAASSQPETGDANVEQTRARNSRHKGARNKQQARGHDTKHQCQFFIGIEEEPKFRVVRRIIGTAGANMKYIAEQAGADTKLRLRGRGSKFFEGPDKQEAPEPLMLCVSVPNRAAYEVVTGLVREQLERVYDEYDNFRVSNGQSALRLRVRMHEGPRAGSR